MDYSRYEKLRALVRGSFSSETQRLVDEALAYADERLAGMARYDGSPLLEHGAGVACIVISEIGLGRNSTLSSILHDVVRIAHKQQTQEEFLALMSDLRARFGEQVAGITMGLCNISELKLKVANEQAGNFRDLIVSYSEDPRVILIKLADRLEVMRSLDIFPREKWRKKSWESMNLYAQIAHKLGLYGLKSELEDIALKYLEPKDYEHIVAKLEESADERRAFIARFIVPIEERLQKLGIRYHIKSRTKSIFSIWNKMQKQRVPSKGSTTSSPSASSSTARWRMRSGSAGRSTPSSPTSTRPTPTACATGFPSPSRTATSRSTRPSRPRGGGSRCRFAPSAWTPWPSAVSRPTGATRG